MDHLEAISAGLRDRRAHHEIARKVFLTYPTKAFAGHEERQFRILDEVAIQFDVPIHSIHVCGSAKLGHSFHKRREFAAGDSDLDLAILDARLFSLCVERVLNATRGYSDLSKFPRRKGASVYREYVDYLARGIFRPDLIPTGPFRSEWGDFFGRLSSKHSDLFRSVSAAVYLSQAFFEQKQRSAIRLFEEYRPV